jgi:hypothetical protein
LFVYRRADTAVQVLSALSANPGFAETDVLIFSDAPRGPDAAQDVRDVREAIRSQAGGNVRLVERPVNMGLAASVVDGVTALARSHGRVIVLEDDLVPSVAFLAWMNMALDRYASNRRVMQVAAHMFDVPPIRDAARGVFLRHPTSKGWGVWERSWSGFDLKCGGWEAKFADREFRERFRVGGAMRYEQMFRSQMAGRLDSWAIRFHYHVVKANGLVLYPPQSLVADVGLTAGKATHGQRLAPLLPRTPLWSQSLPPPLPEEAVPDDWAAAAWSKRLTRSAYGLASRLAEARYRLLVETGLRNR